ncbi:MAG: DUF3027 domain-containing protein [Pseudoclavibacter sp.]
MREPSTGEPDHDGVGAADAGAADAEAVAVIPDADAAGVGDASSTDAAVAMDAAVADAAVADDAAETGTAADNVDGGDEGGADDAADEGADAAPGDDEADSDDDAAALAFPDLDPDRIATPALSTPVGRPLDEPRVAATIDVARDSLGEITSADDIGEFVGFEDIGDGVYIARFATTSTAYLGWFWTVALVQLEGDEQPNVLEAELLPGDDASVAPAWVPWAERLATYRADHDASAQTDEREADADRAPAARSLGRRERRRVRTRVGAESGQSGDTATTAGTPDGGISADATAAAAAVEPVTTDTAAVEATTSRDASDERAAAVAPDERGAGADRGGDRENTTPRRGRRSLSSSRRRVSVASRAQRRAVRDSDAGDESPSAAPESE